MRERWYVEPVLPRMQARLIVLTDMRPQSMAETALQIIKDAGIGTLVGEASAATNGNVARFSLAGGFTAQFTAMRTW